MSLAYAPAPEAANPPPPAITLEPTPTPDLTVEALAVRCGAVAVFENVSFTLPRGEIAALVGANGTGKSTLLKAGLGLVPASEGRVRLLGEALGALPQRRLAALRARCGLVAQKHNLVPRLSVLSNVVHGLLGRSPGPRFWLHALAPAEARAAALDALSRVGLAHLASRRADRLSGGQSQKVAIARALVSRPAIVFADEPAASLDPSAGAEIMALLAELARGSGITVLFTSHHVDHALAFADRVIALKAGRLALDMASDAEHARGAIEALYD